MSYVRTQLGSLFPDYFDSPPPPSSGLSQGSDHQEEGPYVSEVGGRPQIPREVGGVGQQWSVREEIGGLREEIERLRGVVGGLVEGLNSGSGHSVEDQDEVSGERQDEVRVEGHDEIRVEGHDEVRAEGQEEFRASVSEIGQDERLSDTEAFFATADKSAELIRLLDKFVHPWTNQRSDTEIFHDNNLGQLSIAVRLAFEGDDVRL
ncbi:hypothetical protein BCR39DRAFT_513585 [Naematelia encephala]|uniref:Uncharacterized protein n=1 Tax=Naematelia encephala TaxID=71784 RepID=A0A1Y2BII8_9TREE|nr:hypothetical protein BCR39DRAFT_513585 [Naematelia encephala]